MPDYKQGKLYQIWSPHTEKVYIGSTVCPLYKRFYQHKLFKDCTSIQIIKLGDAKIELIEECPCENKEQLHRREGQVIREYGNKCVNMVIAGRTKKEYIENNKEQIEAYKKEYRENNKEQLAAYHKEYRENNKERRQAYNKEYRKNNKEQTEAAHKKYRENNKDRMNARRRELRQQKKKEAQQQK